jgi:hypothetical protein
MSSAKQAFPSQREMRRKKMVADLLTALIAGLILSGLLAAILWFLSRNRV